MAEAILDVKAKLPRRGLDGAISPLYLFRKSAQASWPRKEPEGMGKAKEQREAQRGNARGEVKVALGSLYPRVVAEQVRLGYGRPSEYLRRLVIDHFEALDAAPPAVLTKPEPQPAAARG